MMRTAISHASKPFPLRLYRDKAIATGVIIRDRQDARDWTVSILATALVLSLVMVASAVAEMLP